MLGDLALPVLVPGPGRPSPMPHSGAVLTATKDIDLRRVRRPGQTWLS
jgi:hypothetical protein